MRKNSEIPSYNDEIDGYSEDTNMDLRQRLDKATHAIEDALGYQLVTDVWLSMNGIGRDFSLMVGPCQHFEVSTEEIRRNSGVGLVRLLKIRLGNTLHGILADVDRLELFCHILRGTQPWVLVKGL